MNPSCLVSTLQAGGGVMVWGCFLDTLSVEHQVGHMSIFDGHVHPFKSTVCQTFIATSSRIMYHITKLKSSQTGVNVTMSSLYSKGLRSPQISIQQSIFGMWRNTPCIMDVQLANLQKLHDAIMSIWTKISKESQLKLCHEELRQF